MRKQNGFTVVEVMLVLLIVSFAYVLQAGWKPTIPLGVFMESLKREILCIQQEAYGSKQRQNLIISSHSLQSSMGTVQFPDEIVCEQIELSFNEKGNISKGGTITCTKGREKGNMIFQLGSGRFRWVLAS